MAHVSGVADNDAATSSLLQHSVSASPLDTSSCSGGDSFVSSPVASVVKVEPPGQLVANLIQGISPAVAHLTGLTGGFPAMSTLPLDPDTFRELVREQNMKKARLARKAELARMSRRRKKGRLSDLEVEVNNLKADLERERKARKAAQEQLAAASQSFGRQLAQQPQVVACPPIPEAPSAVPTETALLDEWKKLSEHLRKTLVEAATSPQALQDAARLLTEMASNVKRRSAVPSTQVASMQSQMTQPLPLRFLEWVMNQKEHFYQDQSGLWQSLFHREMGLSPDQVASVLSLRAAVQTQRASAMEIQASYTSLASNLQAYGVQSGCNLDKFVSLLTPEQLCKFFSWVDNYGSVVVQINV